MLAASLVVAAALLDETPERAAAGEAGCGVVTALCPGPRSIEMSEIPMVRDGSVIPRSVSRERLARAWTDLTEGVRKNESRFSDGENDALNAILLQVQGGLLWIGLAPPPGVRIARRWHELQQLVPNVRALCAFFGRKHKENANVPAFRKLRADACRVKEEAERLAAVVPGS